MKTFIAITFQVEGLHNWVDAKTKEPEVGFLSHHHRHMFFFKVKKKVSHDDRDIEIIKYKRELIDYYRRNFYREDIQTHFFAGRSCEMLAKDLMEAYDLDEVEVLEDNENGCVVCK